MRKADTYRGARRNFCIRKVKTTWSQRYYYISHRLSAHKTWQVEAKPRFSFKERQERRENYVRSSIGMANFAKTLFHSLFNGGISVSVPRRSARGR